MQSTSENVESLERLAATGWAVPMILSCARKLGGSDWEEWEIDYAIRFIAGKGWGASEVTASMS